MEIKIPPKIVESVDTKKFVESTSGNIKKSNINPSNIRYKKLLITP
jgi:hypothetical protein